MPRGGARIGAGRKRKDGQPAKSAIPDEWKPKLDLARDEQGMTPLEFMLAVVRDDDLPARTRAAMAVAAAPYVHAKPGDDKQSKGEQRRSAAHGVTGKFAPPAPPRLVSSKG